MTIDYYCGGELIFMDSLVTQRGCLVPRSGDHVNLKSGSYRVVEVSWYPDVLSYPVTVQLSLIAPLVPGQAEVSEEPPVSLDPRCCD